jgi:hypothetical protein
MSFAVTDPRFDPLPAPEQPPADGGEFRDERPKGRGCFFWGCLTLVVLFLVLLIGVPLAAYFAVKHYVNKFTANAPLNIAAVELPEEEMKALEARFEAFDASLEKGQPQDLEVTAKEINAMISQDDQLKGRVLVRIADGKVGGDISIPMDQLPGGGGRYLNATADFDVSMPGGVLMVTLVDAQVNGSPLPQAIVDSFAGENIAKDAYDDPENAEVLRKFESLEIVGDKIILRARKQPAEAPDPPDAPEIEAPGMEAPEIETIEEAEVPVAN